MGSNREKSNIAIVILEKLTKIISHFEGSNNIFADCTLDGKIGFLIKF